MKYPSKIIVAILLLLSFISVSVQASTSPAPTTASSRVITEAEREALLTRLFEIDAMDKTNLRAPEKRKLRREVRGIQQQMGNNGGVYISVGALIIIIILLIILF